MARRTDSTLNTMVVVTAVSLAVLLTASFNVERIMPIVHEFSVELQTTEVFDEIAQFVVRL
jgi:hypothetical protein